MLRLRFLAAVLLLALGLTGGACRFSQAQALTWYDSTYKAQMRAPQRALIDEMERLHFSPDIDAEHALAGLQRCLHEAQRMDFAFGVFKAYYSLGLRQPSERSMPKLAYYDSAFAVARQSEQIDAQISVLLSQAQVYLGLSQYQEAGLYAQKAMLLLQQLPESLSDQHRNLKNQIDFALARVKYHSGEFDETVRIYQEALKAVKQAPEAYAQTGIPGTWSDLGNYYYGLERYDSARHCYREGLAYSYQYDDSTGAGFLLDNIGLTFFKQRQWDSALYYQRPALAYRRKTNNAAGIITGLNNLAWTCLRAGKYQEGLRYGQECFPLSRSTEVLEYTEDACNVLARLYQAVGEPDSAFHYFDLAFQFKDRIERQQRVQAKKGASALMDVVREREEKAKLQRDLAEQDARQTVAVTVVVALVGLLIIIAVYSSKQARTNQQLRHLNLEIKQRNEEVLQQRDQIQAALERLEATQVQLLESEKMAALGGMVAGVAHEINTPVGVGITASSHLHQSTEQLVADFNRGELSREQFQQYLQKVYDATAILQDNLERTAALVQSFKQVSVDQVTEQARSFYLREYIEHVLAGLKTNAKAKDIALTVEIDCPESLRLNSYPGVFAQIITNLFNNALQHAFRGLTEGAITIRAAYHGEDLQLDFADNGRGMDTATQKRVFEPFFTTDLQEGTGLGMHIVYNLVSQKLGGTMRLESKLGQGTQFSILVPKAATLSYSHEDPYTYPV